MGKKHLFISLSIVLIISLISFSCTSKKSLIQLNTKPISIKKFDTPQGADPSVSAEQGGNGFKGEGWTTNTKPNIIGKEDAVKGGRFTYAFPEFPVSIGLFPIFEFSDIFGGLMYESLLNFDPVDKSLIPGLATHWKTGADSMTYYFRINPDARWADGMPVIAEDFVETFRLYTDSTLGQPFITEYYKTSFEMPKAESKYIVSIKAKEKSWRNQVNLIFPVLPAHILKDLPGKDYIEKYQFKYLVGSGPYVIMDEDIKKGESVTLRRRSDYWGEQEKMNTGKFNFDEVVLTVVRDKMLKNEMFKKGELDFMNVNSEETFKTGFDYDLANRNLVLKKKLYNNYPLGFSGLVMNMRTYPFDDIRVRKAFIHLFDRKKFNEKLFDNSFSLFYSYFPNTEFENPSNINLGYSPDSAMALLNEAGWNLVSGKLMKDGKQLEVTLPFAKPNDRYLTIYQEELQKTGIKLELKETDFQTMYMLGNERKFTMIPMNTMGLLIPSPDSEFMSMLADQPNNNNWYGFKDARLDSLCKAYNESFSEKERVNILKELDKTATSLFAFIGGFSKTYRGFAYQNKFGYPDGMIGKYDRYYDVFYYWYIDPDRYTEYQKGLTDKNVTMKKEDVDNKYWMGKK